MVSFELVDNQSLPQRPCFSVGSILVGPYDSAATWDRHWGDTFGSGDCLPEATSSFRPPRTPRSTTGARDPSDSARRDFERPHERLKRTL